MPGEAERPDRPPDWLSLNSAEWYAARDATTALRDVLASAGLQREFPFLRADLNVFGHGFIELGRISPATAHRLADLLRLGLAVIQGAHSPRGQEPT
ncbi:hypothetical protein [Actinacidiphila sp. ITFR-21]|uniref:hypothetical protein n=1 Tax=Actinacidiphila sp. ITFR-21 TaxID=3075199 RepID=UPI002889102A|nr:hypothetical protein [Streptomyces sp. ITFR-21]WNI18074.1 hypothetical protein RLT57_22695 [Streptomyces sp. ITFR-21]